MAFPLSFLEQLRDRVDIAELIGRSVRLTRRGREWIGLCPFHGEKTPSFHVVPEKQFYHCFGCGAHGDVVKFLREHHRLSFIEAVKELAGMAGLEMPKPDPVRQQLEQDRDRLMTIMDRAAAWFHQQLFGEGGGSARAMLTDRNIGQAMVAQFQIGYAPGNVDALDRVLGCTVEEATQLGLMRVGERGRYSFFRERLVLPIRNSRGQTIGFGGRRLRDDQMAKYLNSPDSPLFTKRRTLFNLDAAIPAVRVGQPLLVAEGYLDVVALVEAGFPAAVAPLGTALTSEQLQMLWRRTDTPIVCFDGDRAGYRAAVRVATEALDSLQSGQGVKFGFLPEGHDPDSLIRARGASAMGQLIDQARPLSAFLWRVGAETVSFDRPEEVSALHKHFADLAARCADPHIRRSFQQYWRDQMWQAQRKDRGGNKTGSSRTRKSPVGPVTRLDSRFLQPRMILACMIRHPSLIGEYAESFGEVDFPPHLDKLRQTLQIYGTETDPDDASSESLMTWLAERGEDSLVGDVLHREVSAVAPQAGSSGTRDQARSLLESLGRLGYEQRLIADGERLSEVVADDPEAWRRLQHLQTALAGQRDVQDDGSE